MTQDQDWVDQVAVERALCGRRVGRPLTRAERLQVAATIRGTGGGVSALSRALRCNCAAARELLATVDGGAKL